MSCTNAPQTPARPAGLSPGSRRRTSRRLRLDRPHLPAAQARRELGLLRREGTEPDCDDDAAMTCTPVPQDARRPASGTRCRTSTTVAGQRPARQHPARSTTSTRPPQRGNAAGGLVGRPDRRRQRAPARARQRRPGVRHRRSSTRSCRGPDWDTTAIFLAWDDWGGFYDHVAPPKVDAERLRPARARRW